MISVPKAKSAALAVTKFLGIYAWQRDFRRIPFSIRMANFIAQKIFRLNASSPWAVHYTSRVIHPNGIKLCKSAQLFLALSGGCYLNGQNGITIEEGTIIAPGVKIISSNHSVYDFQKHDPCHGIVIGRNCWLGANCVILPGVILADHVVVAAGAVVTKSFPANSAVAGVPARKIKDLLPYSETGYITPEEDS